MAASRLLIKEKMIAKAPRRQVEGSPIPVAFCLASPGGGDVKGSRRRFRRSPHIGRSGCQVARTVRCVVTDYAVKVRREAMRDAAVGDERCAGKWRIEVIIDVPEEQGTILLVGPLGPWLR